MLQFETYNLRLGSLYDPISCHGINIVVHSTVFYASYPNGKIESPNNTMANITIPLLMNSSHNKELCF